MAVHDRRHVVVAGLPYDGSATYRKGAALAPSELRRVSAVFPPVTEDGRVMLDFGIGDLGNFEVAGRSIKEFFEEAALWLAQAPADLPLVTLGGDHCSDIAVLTAQVRRTGQNLAVVWIDAHPDLCDVSRGWSYSCGCALRRALEHSALDPSRVAVVGGRDFDPEELDFMSRHGVMLVTAAELHRSSAFEIGRNLAARFAGLKLHLSVDVDVLDPAFAPGTEIPSSGGLSSRQLLELLRGLSNGDLYGLDVMEYCPPVDVSEITALAAVKLVYEFLGHVHRRCKV